jgi:hypothetical protein
MGKENNFLDENRIRFYFLLLHFKDFNEEKGKSTRKNENNFEEIKLLSSRV